MLILQYLFKCPFRNETWRYAIYHTLFSITPTFLRDRLVERFVHAPAWTKEDAEKSMEFAQNAMDTLYKNYNQSNCVNSKNKSKWRKWNCNMFFRIKAKIKCKKIFIVKLIFIIIYYMFRVSKIIIYFPFLSYLLCSFFFICRVYLPLVYR